MPAKRVRRSPEAARAEILEAAEALLRDHDWALVSVDQLMERTGMTRSSFYHYFKSVDEVAVALFARVEDEIRSAVDDWLEGDAPSDDPDPEAAAVEALTRMFDVWAGHITLMRAMEHAAGRSGAVYEQWRERLVEGYVAQTAAFIERAVAEGRSDASDPPTLARALILMNLSVATDEARRPEPFSAERLGRTIGRVWASAIYRNS